MHGKIIDCGGQGLNIADDFVEVQLDWSGNGMPEMLQFVLIVPLLGSYEKPDDVSIKLGNGFLHPFRRIQDEGELCARKNRSNV